MRMLYDERLQQMEEIVDPAAARRSASLGDLAATVEAPRAQPPRPPSPPQARPDPPDGGGLLVVVFGGGGILTDSRTLTPLRSPSPLKACPS